MTSWTAASNVFNKLVVFRSTWRSLRTVKGNSGVNFFHQPGTATLRDLLQTSNLAISTFRFVIRISGNDNLPYCHSFASFNFCHLINEILKQVKLINISSLWDARQEVQGYMIVNILFSFTQNPCSSESCLNNGRCSVISFRDGTYKCNCHPGYLGNRCEEEEGKNQTLEFRPQMERSSSTNSANQRLNLSRPR